MSRHTATESLLTLCFICASSLTTQAQAQAQATSCKSTVTGMLEVISL